MTWFGQSLLQCWTIMNVRTIVTTLYYHDPIMCKGLCLPQCSTAVTTTIVERLQHSETSGAMQNLEQIDSVSAMHDKPLNCGTCQQTHQLLGRRNDKAGRARPIIQTLCSVCVAACRPRCQGRGLSFKQILYSNCILSVCPRVPCMLDRLHGHMFERCSYHDPLRWLSLPMTLLSNPLYTTSCPHQSLLASADTCTGSDLLSEVALCVRVALQV